MPGGAIVVVRVQQHQPCLAPLAPYPKSCALLHNTPESKAQVLAHDPSNHECPKLVVTCRDIAYVLLHPFRGNWGFYVVFRVLPFASPLFGGFSSETLSVVAQAKAHKPQTQNPTPQTLDFQPQNPNPTL